MHGRIKFGSHVHARKVQSQGGLLIEGDGVESRLSKINGRTHRVLRRGVKLEERKRVGWRKDGAE